MWRSPVLRSFSSSRSCSVLSHTVRPLLSHCSATAQPLFGHCSATVRPLHDHCSARCQRPLRRVRPSCWPRKTGTGSCLTRSRTRADLPSLTWMATRSSTLRNSSRCSPSSFVNPTRLPRSRSGLTARTRTGSMATGGSHSVSAQECHVPPLDSQLHRLSLASLTAADVALAPDSRFAVAAAS